MKIQPHHRLRRPWLTIQDKPGYGIELHPDVARAHLAPGETRWDHNRRCQTRNGPPSRRRITMNQLPLKISQLLLQRPHEISERLSVGLLPMHHYKVPALVEEH